MNILFLSLVDFNNFDEHNLYTDLLNEFLINGHFVCAVSPVEKRKKRNICLIKNDNYCILKPCIGNIQKTNFIEKGVSMLLLEYQIKKSIKKYFNDIKFDLVLYATPPITFFKVIDFVKKRDNAKTYLLLKDIFPQNAVDLGIFSKNGLKGFLYKYFRKKEKSLYQISDYIGCMSEANVKFLKKHNKELIVKPVEVCPNSIAPRGYIEIDKSIFKQELGIPQDSTCFIFGGNMGRPENIDFVIRCLEQNIYINDRYFIICGTGTDYYKLEKFFQNEKPDNMLLINGLSKKDYDELIIACDVGLIFLDHRFTIPNFPSRLLSYMENAMPVLSSTDNNTDIGRIIKDGDFGWSCSSENADGFTDIVNDICKNKYLIKQKGLNARNYLEKNYTACRSYKIIIDHFSNMN